MYAIVDYTFVCAKRFIYCSFTNHVIGFELHKDGKKGYANLRGQIVFLPVYDNLVHFEHDRSRYMHLYIDGKQGLGDELTGETVVPIEYDNITWRGKYIELTQTGKPDSMIRWDNQTSKVIGTPIPFIR